MDETDEMDEIIRGSLVCSLVGKNLHEMIDPCSQSLLRDLTAVAGSPLSALSVLAAVYAFLSCRTKLFFLAGSHLGAGFHDQVFLVLSFLLPW